MLRGESRLSDGRAVEALKPIAKHGSVVLITQPACDVNRACRIDPEEIPVVGQVMDGAQRQTIHDRGDPLGRGIGDDVGRLHELAFTQRADGAPMLVGAQDVVPESLLVEPRLDKAQRVGACVRGDTGPPG